MATAAASGRRRRQAIGSVVHSAIRTPTGRAAIGQISTWATDGIALAGTYLIGAAIAVATGLGDLTAVLTNGTKLSAPSFIVAAELLGAFLATRYRPGAALVLLASGLSLAAAAFDGDVAHAGLTRPEIAWQGVEVAASVLVFALAAARLTRRPRRPAAAAAA
jgi:hypothetical protein